MNPQQLEGWAALDLDNPVIAAQQEADREKALEIASIYRQTFSTPAGKKCLEMMVKQTLQRPVVKGDSTQFDVGIREGQNDIVRQILANMELASGG